VLLAHPGGGREGASCPSLREQVPPAHGTASGPVTGNVAKWPSEEARQVAKPCLKFPIGQPHPSGSQALIQNGPVALVKPGTSKLAGLAADPESITN
jgi:hypothetical protein